MMNIDEMNSEEKIGRMIPSAEYIFFISYVRSKKLDKNTLDEFIKYLADELRDKDEDYVKHEPLVDRISMKMAEHCWG